MNIFAVDNDPVQAAHCLVDKHVVKMILESAQLLSTAHRVLDGHEYVGKSKSGRNVKRWTLYDDRDGHLYSATHVNHPSAVWCRQTTGNYEWLYAHFNALLTEYMYRYGKIHKCYYMWYYLSPPPANLPKGDLQRFAVAMPEEYKVADPVESYRNYYRVAKERMHKWTKREKPAWI